MNNKCSATRVRSYWNPSEADKELNKPFLSLLLSQIWCYFLKPFLG